VFSCGEPAANINESGNNLIEIDGIKVASPNSGQVQIEYWLANSGASELRIFDLTGRLIYNFNKEFKPAGHYNVKWNGKNNNGQNVPPGVYVCQLTKDNKTCSAQIILTK
jgi:flagellar hook assembly protein FlgD